MAMIVYAARIGITLFLLGAAFAGQSVSAGFRDLFASVQSLKAPFREGEKLSYEVNWKPVFAVPALRAGEVHLAVERSRLGGIDTYKITGLAISDGTLTSVAGFEIENYFESHIDREDYRSYKSFQKIRQGKRKRNLEITFDYENNRTLVVETDHAFSPPRTLKDKIIQGIPAPAADVLSVFYVARLRMVQPGERFQFHLNEKGEFKQVLVTVDQKEEVVTPVGTFSAVKLTTSGGPFRDGGAFRIWYSTDGLRIPVKFEADVKIGKVYGNLIKLETARQTRSVVPVE